MYLLYFVDYDRLTLGNSRLPKIFRNKLRHRHKNAHSGRTIHIFISRNTETQYSHPRKKKKIDRRLYDISSSSVNVGNNETVWRTDLVVPYLFSIRQ